MNSKKSSENLSEMTTRFSSDCGRIFSQHFQDNHNPIQIVYNSYLILIVVVPFLPSIFLRAFANYSIFSMLGPRNKSDYEYLISTGNTEFANTYAGGFILLFLITLAAFFILSYLYTYPLKYVRVVGKSINYFVMMFGFLFLLSPALYFLTYLNDFEFFGGNISWFKDNPEVNTRLTPQPSTRLVFFIVDISFSLVLAGSIGLTQLVLIFCLGKSINFTDIVEEAKNEQRRKP